MKFINRYYRDFFCVGNMGSIWDAFWKTNFHRNFIKMKLLKIWSGWLDIDSNILNICRSVTSISCWTKCCLWMLNLFHWKWRQNSSVAGLCLLEEWIQKFLWNKKISSKDSFWKVIFLLILKLLYFIVPKHGNILRMWCQIKIFIAFFFSNQVKTLVRANIHLRELSKKWFTPNFQMTLFILKPQMNGFD